MCPFLAAGVCYFVFFAVFPLLLGVIALLGYVVSPQWAEAEVLRLLGKSLPAQLAFALDMLHGLVHARGPIGLLATLMLLWSGKSVFMSLGQALDFIWKSPRLSHWHDIVRRNLIAILCALALGGSVLVGSALYVGLAWLSSQRIVFFGLSLSAIPGLMWILSELLPLVFFTSSLLVTYRVLPARRLPLRPLLTGALVAALGWELSRRLFVYYVTYFTGLSLVYGPLTSIIILLLWIYLSAMLYLLGAVVARLLAFPGEPS